jgi:hypothetical protein
MFNKRTSSSGADLLPWYLNHSLSAAEQSVAEDQARHSPQRLHIWQGVRLAAMSQPARMPSALVRQRVLAQARGAARSGRAPRWLPVVSGAVVTVLALVFLWSVVRPGIGLQWSVDGAIPIAFRVYRAPAGSNRFEIMREIPARSGIVDYSFVDTALWPGQTYQYRVEAVNADTVSATIAANGADVLPAQLAIVLSSLLIGLAGAIVLGEMATLSMPASWKAV